MSNGEKLPPQDAEFAILHDPVFEQVMLVGEGRPYSCCSRSRKETDERRLLRRANEQLEDVSALGARAARHCDAASHGAWTTGC